MSDLAEVLKNALSLSANDRAALAERLLASLDDLEEEEADRLWTEEAVRRRQEFQAGRAEAVEAQDVAKKAERFFR
ncbi:MAG: addiction module protein [Terriglobia bacterium]